MGFSDWKSSQSVKPTAPTQLVETGFLPGLQGLPFVYSAKHVELDLDKWFQSNKGSVAESLLEHGAVLFRGFDVKSQVNFSAFVASVFERPAAYVEGATPRTNLGDGVYTSTEFPCEEEIAFHNELSYVTQPPERLAFCCLTPPATGGQTPLADISKVHDRITEETLQAFRSKQGWMLRRHYCEGFGPTVFKAFGLDTLDGIQAYCDKANVRFESLGDNHFLTEQVRSAIHTHPVSGKALWFNHVAFWHTSSLCPKVRAELQSLFGESAFPYSTFFGDGQPIEQDVIDEIRTAYQAEEVLFDWQAGDVLLIDNWRVAHGRKPYSGKRHVLVAMS